jgi:guanylate kinase
MSLMPEVSKGFVLAVSAPSGTGKTSLCDKLATELSYVVRSVSVTTRPKRDGEVTKRDYEFVDLQEFQRRQKNKELIETAEVFGYWYGTPLKPVEEALKSGKVIVMDIDTKGAFAVAEKLKQDCVTLFIRPPSLEELEKRLISRGKNTPEELKRRLSEAAREIGESHRYDYVIGNESFAEAFGQLMSILTAERSRSHRLSLEKP